MLKVMTAGMIVVFVAMVLWYLYDRRRQVLRRRRHRRADRQWAGYAKAWDGVFKRKKIQRITYIEPPEPAE